MKKIIANTPPQCETYEIIEVWASMQAHRGINRDGICPTIGTTDLSLPRIVLRRCTNEQRKH